MVGEDFSQRCLTGFILSLYLTFSLCASVPVFLSLFFCLSSPSQAVWVQFYLSFSDQSVHPNHVYNGILIFWVMSIIHCKAANFLEISQRSDQIENVLELCGLWGFVSLQFSMKISTLGVCSLLGIRFPTHVACPVLSLCSLADCRCLSQSLMYFFKKCYLSYTHGKSKF